MAYRTRWLILALVAVTTLAVPAAASGLALNDTLPLLTPSAPCTLDAAGDNQDVYRKDLIAGETLVLSLTINPAASTPVFDLDLYVYSPTTAESSHVLAVALSKKAPTAYPETISYTAPVTGTYYVEIFAAEGSGTGLLTSSVLPEPLLPVYRFYNRTNGTHFYTPSEAERANVQATLGHVFTFEGPAYFTKATKNTQFLYRFYNRKNGSHFYTASDGERDSVKANLAAVYTYEGPTYKVSVTEAGGKAPVYRFFNRRSGSHFYTASLTERDRVINTLGYLYTYEGPAFYIGR